IPPSVDRYPMVVHPGDALPVSIRFAPATAGSYASAIYVESNGGTNQVGVLGVGLPKQRIATIIPDNGYFGAAAPCEFRDLSLTINNSGNCPLTISDIYALPNLLCCTNASGNGTLVNLTNIVSTTNIVITTNVIGSVATNYTTNIVITSTTNIIPAVASGSCRMLSDGCLAQLFEIP